MSFYEIIEIDAGLTVADLTPGLTPEEVAEKQGGILVDPGPYPDYDDAFEALMALQSYDDEDHDLD